MISCVERASLHFCSDAAAARVANTPMQPSGASHRLCEAYCQRPAGRSCPAAHAAFHDFFFAASPAPGVGAQVELSARAAAPCEAGTPRAGCRARRRLVRAGQHGALPKCGAEPKCVPELFIFHACTAYMLSWVVKRGTSPNTCGQCGSTPAKAVWEHSCKQCGRTQGAVVRWLATGSRPAQLR